MYDDAGVLVEIVKVDGIFGRSDDELDYSFTLAKAIGARAISTEISQNQDDLKRVGQFADKHQLMVGYHGHTETGPADWEKAFSYAKFNGANLDIGHFVGGHKTSPIPFLKQHHEPDHAPAHQGQDAAEVRTSRSARATRQSRKRCSCCATTSGRFRPRSNSSTRCPPDRIAWPRWPSASSSARIAWCNRHRERRRQRSRQGVLSSEDLGRIAREGLARLPLDGRRVLVIIPDGTRSMPDAADVRSAGSRARPARRRARFSRRARHPLADDRRAAQPPSRAAGRQRPRRHAPGSSITAGTTRPRSPTRHDSGARDRRSHRRAARRGRARRAQPARRRVRPRAHLRPGVSARGRGVFRRDEVSLPGDRGAADHSFHALARRADHELRGDRHGGHAGARRHQSCGVAARHPRLAPRARRRARRRGRAFLRRRQGRVAAGGGLSARRHVVWVDEPFDRCSR